VVTCGALGSGPVAGRLVSAVELGTGARYSTTTYVTGGFTLLVPPGRYRLEVALARAERVAEGPGVLDSPPAPSSATRTSCSAGRGS
jgi:hypothetical protein